MAWFRRQSERPSATAEHVAQLQTSLDDVREGLRAARQEIADIHGLLVHTLQKQSAILLEGMQGVKAPTLASAALIRASYEAVQRIAEQLYGRNILVAPTPKTDPYLPAAGNVMIPLDPDFQCELRITSPLHPDIYTARLFLPREYATVDDDLPGVRPGAKPPEGMPDNRPRVKRIALHIDSRKAPHNLIKALLALHENYHATLWLVQRDPIREGDNLTEMVSREWQCVKTMHHPGDDETAPWWPHDYIFYFDHVPTEHATTYNTVEGMPMPHYEAAPSDNAIEPPKIQ